MTPPFFPSLPAAPKPGARLDLPPLSGSADALAIAELARPGRLLAVVAASPLEAQRLLEEVTWFAPALRVHLLPDWETLPYDSFSPHQDLISERLATLHAVTRGECDVLIVAAATALARMAPPSHLVGHTFFLKQGDKLDLDRLRGQLTLAGYQHVTQELVASMLGVRREGITVAAGDLQRAGYISYRRGHIAVLNRSGLEASSCECYAVVKKEYDRLLPARQAS